MSKEIRGKNIVTSFKNAVKNAVYMVYTIYTSKNPYSDYMAVMKKKKTNIAKCCCFSFNH